MKGAKGGNRDRIISWLFSEKNRKKREEELEIEKNEEVKTDEKHKDRQKGFDIKDQGLIEVSDTNIKPKDEITSVTTPLSLDENNNNNIDSEINDYVIEQSEGEVTNSSNDDNDKNPSIVIDESDKDIPNLFIDASVVEEIKDYNRQKDNDKDSMNSSKDVDEVVTEVSLSAELDEEKANNLFPEVKEISIHEDEVTNDYEAPELITISIIEEIESLIKDDAYDLKDIKYQIEVLNLQEQDEVLLENIEKIQKELELLIKRFEEIKRKYEFLYSNISISDLEVIAECDIEHIISNYISDGKAGIDSSNTIDQIKEFEEFIGIINDIINIEKQKDLIQDSVDHKLVDFNIRDEEFIKLQDQYTNIESINNSISKYNNDIGVILNDIENKIANSVDVNRSIETTINIVPDINRIMSATMLLASAEMIPPTPAGSIFKATLFISAVHMMANAFTPREESKEVVKTTVSDYSKDVLNNKQDLKSVLNNINDAFSEINYMKDLFEKEFSQYSNQIPEYDKLIKNIFAIETELSRQQSIIYDYDHKFEQALALNNQKVKVLENE